MRQSNKLNIVGSSPAAGNYFFGLQVTFLPKFYTHLPYREYFGELPPRASCASHTIKKSLLYICFWRLFANPFLFGKNQAPRPLFAQKTILTSILSSDILLTWIACFTPHIYTIALKLSISHYRSKVS